MRSLFVWIETHERHLSAAAMVLGFLFDNLLFGRVDQLQTHLVFMGYLVTAAIFIFPRRAVDESPDYVIYMVTIALGFAAAENVLFLLGPLSTGDLIGGILTDNMRFLGATLLHVIASSAIGFALAFSYMKPRGSRILYAAGGLILAVVLHTAFNALIILGSGAKTLSAFLLVWSAAVVFFALFEILKYFRYQRLPKNTC
jgi:RsiW-degrading membrane proteinase PrsW (M82 family)